MTTKATQRLWRDLSRNHLHHVPKRLSHHNTFTIPRRNVPLQSSNRHGNSPSYFHLTNTNHPKHQTHQRRALFTSTGMLSNIPTPLIPPAIFLGLLLGLWTWKCFWIVLMQDKLLYLSWLPPLSRSEGIADYEKEFRGIIWTEGEIRSLDGTRLAVCEGRLPSTSVEGGKGESVEGKVKKRVVICYFQGNGGSTPLRLPLLSQVMKSIQESNADETEYILVALSYRGYWKSSGRAAQKGIQKDAHAFLAWVYGNYTLPDGEMDIILWGHSLGAAVASSAVVRQLSDPQTRDKQINGLILEAPISSIKDMLISLYPQKWLPYRYLWPLSWNTWDVEGSLEDLARFNKTASDDEVSKGKKIPPILLLSAESDEVIPSYVADNLENKAKALGLDLERKDVKGAMHIEAPLKLDGRNALVESIMRSSRHK